jgi:hypothetical protein
VTVLARETAFAIVRMKNDRARRAKRFGAETLEQEPELWSEHHGAAAREPAGD